VYDNGAGIPKNVVDKIFQPFFTKPNRAGERIKLADMILGRHMAAIKVETNEGEALLIILLNVFKYENGFLAFLLLRYKLYSQQDALQKSHFASR
jgi:nitrogen-specific signal transduction histidine kinase